MSTKSIQELSQEIILVKTKILAIHKQGAKIIHSRADVNEPLTVSQEDAFMALNKKCEELMVTLKSLETRQKALLADIERAEKLKVTTLTIPESKLLNLLYEYKHQYLRVNELSKLSHITRNRLYEHLRSFLVGGLVTLYTSETGQYAFTKGYTITDKGISFIEKRTPGV
jgi:DNA-binding MarR family transcriptional regulator